MSLYAWLKKDPIKRYPLLQTDWHSLYAQYKLSKLIKAQLHALARNNLPLTDAVLYFVNVIQEYNSIYYTPTDMVRPISNIVEMPALVQQFLKSKDVVYLYSMVQLVGIQDDIRQVYLFMTAVLDLYSIEVHLNVSELRTIYYLQKAKWRRYPLDLSSYVMDLYVPGWLSYINTISMLDNIDILRYCDKLLLQRIRNSQTFAKLIMLLQDTEAKDVFKKYKSINELQKQHDTEAKIKLDALRSKYDSNMYIYHEDFKNIVEKYGYILPIDEMAFVIRGNQHHNCVANYTKRHTEQPSSSHVAVSRIIFNADATIELSIFYMFDLITRVEVSQSKGKNNVSIPITKKLVQLCIELAGKSISILASSKKEVEKDGGN